MLRLYTADGELQFATFEELKEYFDKLEAQKKKGRKKKEHQMYGIAEGPIKVVFD